MSALPPACRGVPAMVLIAVLCTACGGGRSYQGMDAPTLYQLAETERDEGKLDDAVQTLDRLLISFGDWERLPDARMMLADVYFEKEEYLTARSEYQRFLDRYPGHRSAPGAALGACRSLASLAPVAQRDQGYTAEAISVCRNVVIDYSGSTESAESATIANDLRLTMAEKDFLNAEFYFRRKLYDSAIKYYEFVANLYAETEYAPKALLGIYLSNRAIGYDDLAEDARDRLLADYPDSESASQVRANDNGA